MSEKLYEKKCVPCEGGIPPYGFEEIEKHKQEIGKEWKVVGEKMLSCSFEHESFMDAMSFVNQVAAIAEEQGHHPDIHIYYKEVKIELYTHAIDGLHLNDFIIAAQIDELLKS